MVTDGVLIAAHCMSCSSQMKWSGNESGTPSRRQLAQYYGQIQKLRHRPLLGQEKIGQVKCTLDIPFNIEISKDVGLSKGQFVWGSKHFSQGAGMFQN